MSDRNASASLLGYDYQLIHTFIDILNANKDDAIITIEGIEDLDIEDEDSSYLIQYKYHELENYQDSKVAKPIGLMFNHYINNVENYIKYNLYIYLNDDLPSLDKDRISKILKLKSATDFYTIEDSKKNQLELLIEGFFNNFSWKKTEKYEVLLKSLEQKVCDLFNIDIEEAEFVVIPNGLRILMAKAISKTIGARKITKTNFTSQLKNSRNIVSSSYLAQHLGKDKYVKFLKAKLRNQSVTKNGSDFIVYFNNVKRHEIEHLIVSLSKQFFFKGNKIDYRPITFILNCTTSELELLKRKIIELSISEGSNIKFNDGYERYFFSIQIFNEKAVTTTIPNRTKVNEVNYNFRIISFDTFCQHKKNVRFINPTCFIIDNHIMTIPLEFSRIIPLDRVDNEEIIILIGGC
ncbi:hypothetical protein QE109_04635 [Fusibacter bizertensis]|uniref:DUF4297 domain-containing protein n=1 Tax=Fusibacter bizertensis TaxID=1488331 RepID=A0ABT6NAH6_9FIRM|nr:hypothetical protein [Fusibacter bizertensis]MDH8677420.1 hypothetical protein [Fusibacter bizertensis]